MFKFIITKLSITLIGAKIKYYLLLYYGDSHFTIRKLNFAVTYQIAATCNFGVSKFLMNGPDFAFFANSVLNHNFVVIGELIHA